jgi:hypothetical protein
MSNLWINIRFWYWHLQVGPWQLHWKKNHYVVERGFKYLPRFKVYEFFSYRGF